MAISHIPEERAKQLVAIDITLATAPKIQEDLKTKFGYGENKFFDLDLIEYRINNSALDIAEDLDLEERYGLINDLPRETVGRAFRGHHNKKFKPEYQFNGLLGKITNDIIEKSRDSISGRLGGLKASKLGVGVHGRTPEEMSKNGQKGGQATIETHGDQIRNGALASAEAQGKHVWSLEEIVEIANFREESFNHSSKLHPNSPNWKYTTSKMNEKYDKDYTTVQVRMAYNRNKDLLSEDENEVKVKNVMERLQTELYNLMSKDLSINIPAY